MIKFLKGFKYAALGIASCFMGERNFRFHVFAAIAVYIFSFIYGLDRSGYIAVTFAVFFVLAFEAINTAIESCVDLVTKENNPMVKKAKDVAAGAVLLAAASAFIAAFFIFSDLERVIYTFSILLKMPNIIGTIIYITLWGYFVFYFRSKAK